jgi:hypothetical protein
LWSAGSEHKAPIPMSSPNVRPAGNRHLQLHPWRCWSGTPGNYRGCPWRRAVPLTRQCQGRCERAEHRIRSHECTPHPRRRGHEPARGRPQPGRVLPGDGNYRDPACRGATAGAGARQPTDVRHRPERVGAPRSRTGPRLARTAAECGRGRMARARCRLPINSRRRAGAYALLRALSGGQAERGEDGSQVRVVGSARSHVPQREP